MNLIDLSIRRKVFAWILMSAMIIFGAISLNKLGISQMPDVDFPVLNISVSYPGAAPEVVESDLVDPIEQRLLTIEGVKQMRSTAQQGSASVNLEFEINRNVDVALQEVQSALSQLRMPEGVDPPVIRKSNPEEDPILIVSIFGGASLKEMLDWTNNYLLDQLRFLPGVGEVSVAGFPDRNLRIWLDPTKLRQNELTVSDVTDALATQHLESAAGQFVDGKRELRVRWLGEAVKPEEIGDIRIFKRGGQTINYRYVLKIKDVAKVEDGLSDIRRIARADGKTAIAISIKKQRGTNEVVVSESVRKKLAEIKEFFPANYNYRVNVDFTKSTKATVELTIEKLIVAAIITIVICFLFLGSFQAAVNILFSIPTSIVGTCTILYFSGFTLNLFTLLALTLAISIVVDDAIMLLENIVRHYRMGKDPDRAASDGSKEVLPAAIAATLAVIAVFLPVVFMSGIIGKFFFQFGVTMSAAVLLSLLEAVTITPMRAASLLRTSPKISDFEKKLDLIFENLGKKYAQILALCLRKKGVVVVGSILFFALSILIVTKLRQEFVPSQDQDLILVTGQAKPGSSLETTNAFSEEMEAIVKKQPEVLSYVVSVGGGGGSSGVSSVFMPLTLKPRSERSLSHTQIMDRMREEFKKIKGGRISMRDISARNLSTGRLNPVAFNLRGPDLNILNAKVQELMDRLENEKLAVDMDTDYRLGIPELLVIPNREKMGERGVSVEAVSKVLTAAVGGLRQGQYTADGRRYDIRFKIPDELIKSAEDIKRLNVRNTFGNLLPLADLVETKEQSSSQSITRMNRQRAISVYGNLYPGQSQATVLEKASNIAKEILAPGYSFVLEGASAGFSEAFASLYSALLIGILVAYMILAVQFDSFVHPISILMALPFSVTGALLTLWVSGSSLNLFSFIGLIVLMGIAKKNSIMLVEFTNHVRNKENKDPYTSLLEACPVRLRPILMTSAATVFAALPLLIGNSIGSETRKPMGYAIVGGTIVSTLLTLFVVPAMYLLLTKFESKRKSTI